MDNNNNNTIEDLKADIDWLQGDVEERDEIISDLKTQLARAKSQALHIEADLVEITDDLRMMDKRYASLRDAVGDAPMGDKSCEKLVRILLNDPNGVCEDAYWMLAEHVPPSLRVGVRFAFGRAYLKKDEDPMADDSDDS
jgi:hypothetical protein